jgi:hypothetical protein
MSKEQEELLNEVYKKYQSQTMFHTDDLLSLEELDGMDMSTGEIKKIYRQYAPKEFINKCKTEKEFAENWGLKIEERKLSLDERYKLYQDNVEFAIFSATSIDFDIHNIPTKQITITYNDKTIESI